MSESDHGHGKHDHDHDEAEHGHDHGGGWREVLHGLSVRHRHDAADSIDQALESSNAGVKALKISLALLGVTAALQAAVVVLSGSVALLGDTLHNVSDALTALPLWLAFSLGRRAPNRRFTYGFGRAEDLAGVFVVAVIAASVAAAAFEAVERLLHPHKVGHLPLVMAAAVVGMVGNELVTRYRITIGRRIGSAALVADGLHARTDGVTSLAVFIGAVGVAFGLRWADPWWASSWARCSCSSSFGRDARSGNG